MTTEPTPELLPCPWCGGPALLKETILYSTGKPSGLFWVQCDPCDTCPDSCCEKPRDEAISAWNTRAHQPQPVDVEKVIKQAIEHARGYSTPSEDDPRRVYTPAQMEIAIRSAIAAMGADQAQPSTGEGDSAITGKSRN